MGEERHDRTHLCFLISEGLCGHFGWNDETTSSCICRKWPGEITDENHSKTGRCQQAHNDSWWAKNTLPLFHLSLTCPTCTILENIIRGKTERGGSFSSLFSVSNALCFIRLGVIFLPLPNLSFTSWTGGGGGGLLLWGSKVLPVHCAAGCQVKLGSTGSVSVKKSIRDGRLLPGKSVLIPGLILDQRLLQNDMPLAWKWTHSAVEIGWKCVRWLPRLLVLTLQARGLEVWRLSRALRASSIFQDRANSAVASEYSQGHCCPAAANALRQGEMHLPCVRSLLCFP